MTQKRYVSIWFRHLLTDYLIRKDRELKYIPFVVAGPSHGKMMVLATNALAEDEGVYVGMVLADARALVPQIENFDDKPELAERVLGNLAEWCVRYTPNVAVQSPDCLILDVTGCAHLWGGEHNFLKELVTKLRSFGYDARAAMADTYAVAWAVAHFAKERPLVPVGGGRAALAKLPPAALNLSDDIVSMLKRLGIRKIETLYDMPAATLNKRFGKEITLRLSYALSVIPEKFVFKPYVEAYIEDLPTPEGVAKAEDISGALEILLEKLCTRLDAEQKGARSLVFTGYRLDGNVETVEIGTNTASRDRHHLYKLFENKLDTIEPALGIELFTLSADQIEDINFDQKGMLDKSVSFDSPNIRHLIDTLGNKFDPRRLFRFVPRERHWPEQSLKATTSLSQGDETHWQTHKLRPIRLLPRPELIEVTAPVPDYPPMLFRFRGKMHRVRKADGPERIEKEWWIEKGSARDYFRLEDEVGQRYWVFRDGTYQDNANPNWYLHGFFA